MTQTPAPLAVLEWTRTSVVTPVAVSPPESRRRESAPGDSSTRLMLFPKVHTTFLNFQLVSELGSGAFGKVFLAKQLGLAGRLVALKVTSRPTTEPEQLAKLHHTNIVPIYSVHDAAPFEAVCMPYLGSRTLADVVVEYQTTGVFPRSSIGSPSTKAQGRSTTVVPKPTGVPARYRFNPASAPAPAAVPAAVQIEWVLQTALGMARGLQHAHERGILHLDVKPANVLIADDGRPLLLDFNLSLDRSGPGRERTGGTLPYMAPEQLEEFRDRNSRVQLDERTDLFGLGVILFELVTGRHPYPRREGREEVPLLLRDRAAGPPSVRAKSRGVSPAVESIIRTLLQPKPEARYPSARELIADLERHLADRPLAYAPNPSVRERLAKWRRRNPRVWVHGAIAALVLATVGLAGTTAYNLAARADAAAAQRQRLTLAELPRLRLDLLTADDEHLRQRGQRHAQELLAGYGLVPGQAWSQPAAIGRLSTQDRAALNSGLAELCRLLATSVIMHSNGKPREAVTPLAREALAWNELAGQCYGDVAQPKGLFAQRRHIAGVLDLPQEAAPETVAAEETTTERFLAGVDSLVDGRYTEALARFEAVTLSEPGHSAAQFLVGYCRHQMGDYAPALERYQIAKALDRRDGRVALNRGAIRLLLGQSRLAEAEFGEAIADEARRAEAYKLRATARTEHQDYCGAAEDLTKFLELEPGSIQGYLLRAEVYGELGDATAQAADALRAKACLPASAQDFVVRGTSRLARDPAGALEDYIRAVEANPSTLGAWQNQAHVYADYFDQPRRALEAQNRAIALAPEFSVARVGRAVLHARLGDRDAAHADACKALLLSRSPAVHYQAACVYSLTASEQNSDLETALGHLRKALNGGYRDFDTLRRDPDLKAVRDHEDFRSLLRAVEQLQTD